MKNSPPRLLQVRCHSLLRANAVSLIAFALGFRISHFPGARATPWMLLPLLLELAAAADAARCLQHRANLYQGAVLLSLYMHLMVLTMLLFLLLWPYFRWML